METFKYTKSWRSPEDFPTVETSEAQVRDDLQCLFDEAAAGINALVTAVNEGGMGGGAAAEYTLPAATKTTLGGVKAEAVTSADTQSVRISADGFLYTAAHAATAVDASLTRSGAAADAKTVGDKLGDIAAILDEINGEVV